MKAMTGKEVVNLIRKLKEKGMSSDEILEIIEYIEKNDICDHHRHKNTYQVIEREILRPENTVTGHIHHSVAHGGADEHANRGDYHDTLERRRFRA